MIEAILFDFDGTIADTAPDLGYALNRQLIARGFSPLPIEQIRTQASAGSRGLLNLGFNLKPGDSEYETMRDEWKAFVFHFALIVHRSSYLPLLLPRPRP